VAEREARVMTEAKDQGLAGKVARWVLLLPLSGACGVGIGLGFRALFSFLGWKSGSGAVCLAEGSSAALAGAAFLTTAHSVAPFWKRGVLAILASVLLLLNVSQVLAALWSLARQGAGPVALVDVAEGIGLALAAGAALVFVDRGDRG
jgi:hypothetical protein